MKERSRARSWALQVLYAWESRGAEGSPVAVLREFLAERRISEAARPYLDKLIRTYAQHRDEVDRAVQSALTNWRMERLAAIDRNILRIAATELLYIADVPPRVTIQEAILLAEKYGTAESPRFINGVVDAMVRRLEGRA